MRSTIGALLTTALLVVSAWECFAPPPKESLRVRLADDWGERIGEDTAYVFKLTDTLDVTLPPVVTQSVPWVPPAGRSPRLTDTVTVKAVITKKGYVKRVWIHASTNPYFNKAVLKSILLTQFQPALRKGIPYDTLITIPVPLVP